jgi:hypothetical protein
MKVLVSNISSSCFYSDISDPANQLKNNNKMFMNMNMMPIVVYVVMKRNARNIPYNPPRYVSTGMNTKPNPIIAIHNNDNTPNNIAPGIVNSSGISDTSCCAVTLNLTYSDTIFLIPTERVISSSEVVINGVEVPCVVGSVIVVFAREELMTVT